MMVLSWMPLLAQIPTEHYERIGYYIGAGMICVFVVVSIVMAFVKRTTEWVVAGSICGFFVVARFGGVGLGVLLALLGKSGKSQGTDATEIITGNSIPYTIEEPAGWTPRRDVSGYDLLLSDSRGYVAVMADKRSFGTTESYAQFARQRISAVAPGTILGSNQPAQIHERTWVCFTASASIQTQPFAYLCYVYSGPEGSVQLTGWGPQNDWAQEGPMLDRIMHSFQFPPVVASAPN